MSAAAPTAPSVAQNRIHPAIAASPVTRQVVRNPLIDVWRCMILSLVGWSRDHELARGETVLQSAGRKRHRENLFRVQALN